MRNRTGILFLLALILGAAPLIQTNNAQQRCADLNGADDGFFGFGSNGGCDSSPQSDLMKGLRFLSIVCVVCGVLSGVQAWRERRREQEFLHEAGVDVDERELPLDG